MSHEDLRDQGNDIADPRAAMDAALAAPDGRPLVPENPEKPPGHTCPHIDRIRDVLDELHEHLDSGGLETPVTKALLGQIGCAIADLEEVREANTRLRALAAGKREPTQDEVDAHYRRGFARFTDVQDGPMYLRADSVVCIVGDQFDEERVTVLQFAIGSHYLTAHVKEKPQDVAFALAEVLS